jgi:GntR family transcriptional regulator
MRWQIDVNAGALYAQIIRQVEHHLASGLLKPGDKLPSARDLAVQLGINPNTVIHAYNELEVRQLSETRRGLGTFIRVDVPVAQLKEQQLARAARQYLEEAHSLGCSREQALGALMEITHE